MIHLMAAAPAANPRKDEIAYLLEPGAPALCAAGLVCRRPCVPPGEVANHVFIRQKQWHRCHWCIELQKLPGLQHLVEAVGAVERH